MRVAFSSVVAKGATLIPAVALSLCVVCGAPDRASAFGGGAEIGTPDGPFVRTPSSEGAIRLAYSDRNTAAMERRIREGVAACERLPWQYGYDCLGWVLNSASRLNANHPDYRDARGILKDASRQLDAIVTRYVDPAKPVVKSGGASLRGVQDTSRRAVTQSTTAVLDEARTRLLRSGGSRERQLQFARIAAAVDSSKVLLRAALPGLDRLIRLAGAVVGPALYR